MRPELKVPLRIPRRRSNRRGRQRLEATAHEVCVPFLEFAHEAGMNVRPWTHGADRDRELRRRLHVLDESALRRLVDSVAHGMVNPNVAGRYLGMFKDPTERRDSSIR